MRLVHAVAPLGSSVAALVAAAPDRVLVRRSLESGATALFSGPLGGPLTTLESCLQDANLAFPPAPALGTGLAVWSAAGCVRDRVRIDYAGSTQTIDSGGFLYSVAAAGHYAAWLSNVPSGEVGAPDSTRLTVYDAQAGKIAYSVVVPPGDKLDVDENGTAVLGAFPQPSGPSPCGRSPRARVTYYTAAEPVEHEVPVTTCFDTVRIAAGRIGFVQRVAGGADRLALTDLTGAPVQPVARVDQFPPVADFDYDGTRFAWTQIRCRDSALLRRDAADPSPPDAAVSCPVLLGKPRVGRDGSIHLPVSCQHGCRPAPGASQQGVTIVAPSWLHALGKRRHVVEYAPYVPVNLKPGGRGVVRLPLTARQRAQLRRRPRVTVHFKVVLQDVFQRSVARTLTH